MATLCFDETCMYVPIGPHGTEALSQPDGAHAVTLTLPKGLVASVLYEGGGRQGVDAGTHRLASERPLASVEVTHAADRLHAPQRLSLQQGGGVAAEALRGEWVHTEASRKRFAWEDITLVTQLSVNRLPRLVKLMDAWRGPISVVVYVRPHR